MTISGTSCFRIGPANSRSFRDRSILRRRILLQGIRLGLEDMKTERTSRLTSPWPRFAVTSGDRKVHEILSIGLIDSAKAELGEAIFQ